MFISGFRPSVSNKLHSSRTYSFLKGQILEDECQRKKSSLSIDWEHMVKTTKEEAARTCDFYIHGATVVDNQLEFCTGSKYNGKWNELGMTDFGTYKLPHGCEYQGSFEDGRFHGRGVLRYPMGQVLQCKFDRGVLVWYNFFNIDGKVGEEKLEYCKFPDRRFNIEHMSGFQPPTKEYLTNQQPTRPLPEGMCDTGDGYFNPETLSILQSRDPALYLKIDRRKEKERAELKPEKTFWVNALTLVGRKRAAKLVRHCRKGWDEPAGYRPDLYEEWVSGRKKELEMMDENYENIPLDNMTESS